MSRKLLKAALQGAIVALAFAGPAVAQMPQINMLADQPSKTPEEIERRQAQDKAYKESLRKIPDAKTSSDPWDAVRATPAPPKAAAAKSAGRAAQAKPKAAAAPN